MAAEEIMSIDKKEEHYDREGSDDSMDSMPEGELEGDGDLGAAPEVTGQVKRKGGRKPVRFRSGEHEPFPGATD